MLICRSGKRSADAGNALEAAGFTDVVNVLQGFEGELDDRFHRSTVNGWRFRGLLGSKCEFLYTKLVPAAFLYLIVCYCFFTWISGLTTPTTDHAHQPAPAQALDVLQEVFGYTSFRGPQAGIVAHVLGGGDALVLMPTGGGKSRVTRCLPCCGIARAWA